MVDRVVMDVSDVVASASPGTGTVLSSSSAKSFFPCFILLNITCHNCHVALLLKPTVVHYSHLPRYKQRSNNNIPLSTCFIVHALCTEELKRFVSYFIVHYLYMRRSNDDVPLTRILSFTIRTRDVPTTYH